MNSYRRVYLSLTNVRVKQLICKYLDASKDQTHSSFASNSVLVKHPMAALNEYCQIHHFSFETTYPTANQQGAVCSIQVLQKDMTVVEFTSEFYNSKALAKSFAAEGTLKRLKDLASATAESQQPNQLTGVSSMDSCLDPKDILSFDVPMDISQ